MEVTLGESASEKAFVDFINTVQLGHHKSIKVFKFLIIN